MLLTHSHAAARLDADGRPVPLADQDRARWDQAMIAEGTALLDAAVALASRRARTSSRPPSRRCTRQAPSFEQTDWPQIAALYGELARRTPSPVVEVNRAVAVGMADGPLAGLAVLDAGPAVRAARRLRPAARGARRPAGAGRAADGAAAAWARAIDATENGPLRDELIRRAAQTR